MKQVITAKLKLHTSPAQFQALRQTQLAYRDALNYVSRHAYAHGKMSSARALQRDCYAQIRVLYRLPAQMACNVPRQVGATYKTLWTKCKQNAAARQTGQTKKRYKGLDKAPKYISPTLTYNYKYDYSLKSLPAPQAGFQRVSVLTLVFARDYPLYRLRQTRRSTARRRPYRSGQTLVRPTQKAVLPAGLLGN